MNITDMVNRVKKHPDFAGVGMILCHNGVVRKTSASGDKQVESLVVEADHERLAEVVARHKQMPGIIEILAEIADGRELSVGDDIMLLVVAGDVRTNVIPVMTSLIDEVKATVTSKKEIFKT